MKRMDTKRLQWLFLLGLPLSLLAVAWSLRPFTHSVSAVTLSTRTLSAVQVSNLRVAARYLDGVSLRPGEVFSFNRWVGPRTEARGYRNAPSYLEGGTSATMGGGICLLSSAVYQLALQSGMEIRQRVPHLRTIHSVPPGLDATVWYGGADLQFVNTRSTPIQLAVSVQSGALKLTFSGRETVKPQAISRLVNRRNRNELLVVVLRNRQIVSRDLYRLSP
jgi:vancomycin resistance protein VanW